MPDRDERFRVGELRRQVRLGSEATYRVIEVDSAADVVVVEVITAPGLSPGRQLRLTRDAVAGMAVIPASGPSQTS